MYKKNTRKPGIPYGLYPKLWLIMRLTTVIFIASLMQVSASSMAQRITLSATNVPLKSVLKQMRLQSGYVFLYSETLIKDAKPVSINIKDAEFEDVLKQVFSDQPLIYTINEKTIIIKNKEEPPLAKPVDRRMMSIDIYGKISDGEGKALSAVSVKVKGTKSGVISDGQGKFKITVPDGEVILVFSYVGYRTLELSAKQGMSVMMQPELNKLNEMVVVGYGSTRRKDLTGSVASVELNEVKNVPFATLDQALTGKAAGVQVVQADGSPGGVAKIRIRGGTSLLGGNDPLYIIDGVQVQIQNRYLQSAAEIVNPMEGFGGRGGGDGNSSTVSGSFARGLNSLGGLSINDIESIDILKDASATAIYGSRAANGVIIITTKKGKLNQKPIVEANYYSAFTTPIKEKLLDRDQYIMIMKEAAKNLNDARAASNPVRLPDPVASSILTDPNFFGTANTDWLGLVLRTGITQNADLSLRGGGTASRYYASLSYNKNNGTLLGTDFTRLSGKISLDNEVNQRLRLITNLDYGFTTNNIDNGVYTQALFTPPTVRPYNDDGSVHLISPAENGTIGSEGFQNPLALLQGTNKGSTVSLIGSQSLEYDILKELKFRSTVSVNFNSYQQSNYVPSTVLISLNTGNSAGSSNNGTATQAHSQTTDTFFENTLTWDKQFNSNHRLNLLGGTSWQITKSNSFSASGQGFPDDIYLNNISSAAITLPSTGISGQNSLLSFYMRTNYALYEKYLFTFTGRSDASSKFSRKNRVGYFPSGGVAWRISQENFLKNVTWINEIKLRASMGYTGTQNIGDNLFYTLYTPVSYNGTNALVPSQLGNDDLKWESTLQKDVGIDFQFFNARITGGIGYYEKSTSGVLYPARVASSSGSTGVTANIADIRNRGIEMNIKADFIRHKNFQWSATLNISGNRSKVMALSNDFVDPASPGIYRYGNTVLKVGEPIGLLYGATFEGILRTQQEVDDYKRQYAYSLTGQVPYLAIGDARYALDPAVLYQGTKFPKRGIIGNAEPKYYGGITNNLSYKNLNLIAMFTFSKGGDIYYLADVENQNVRLRTNKGVSILDRWTPENPNADRPRLVLGQGLYNNLQANNNVYDASYIRLKSITLNYTFTKRVMDKLKLSNASVYVSAMNLFTITSYPGADPEVSNNPYSLIGGYSDSGGYPTVRQCSVGVRLGL